MERVRAEYPYDDYYLYVVFHKGEGRRYANLISITEGKKKRKTISYARYLMSVKEKRILLPSEHVDHKDNNKMNDNIDNLQILTLRENNIKEGKRHGMKMVELKCPNCEKVFVRRKGNTHLEKSRKSIYTCCSRSCSGVFQHEILKHTLKSIIGIQNNVIREFIQH